MAIPSGSGSEILTRGYFTVTDTTDTKIIDGAAANSTFVFNERLVLHGTDELNFKANAACEIDIIINYIAQNWT